MNEISSPTSYYVDEAGDGVLFRSAGRDRLADPDAARFFILGMVWVESPLYASTTLRELRQNLHGNPLYGSISSFAKARAFHAKDDHPEIRSKVFDLIIDLEFKIFAVVKDMRVVRDYVRRRNRMDAAYRYHPNELYDFTVRMLVKQRLHQANSYRLVFARRGKSDRTAALRQELLKTRERFRREHPDADASVSMEVVPAYPHEQACLQLTDYALWAIQRCYERGEARFLEALWPKVSLIHDVDDTDGAPYGKYLTRKGPCPDPQAIRNR